MGMEQNTRFTVDRTKCTRCGKCVNVCSGMVIGFGADGYPEMKPFERYGWRGCWRCEHCLAVCPAGAVSIFGKKPENSLPPPPPEMGDYMERLVVNRRSCRRYLDKNVDPEIVSRILNALASAPTGGNSSSVEYTVIDDKERVRQIWDIAYAGMEEAAKRRVYTSSFSNFYYKKMKESEKTVRKGDLLFCGAPHLFIAHELCVGKWAEDSKVNCNIATTYFELSGFGNFGGFGNMERFAAPFNEQGENQPQDGFDPSNMFGGGMPNIPEGELPQDFDPSQRFGNREEPDGNRAGGFDRNMFGGGMGSSDVKLQYIDDDPNSYSSIFSSAKTEITNADKSRLIESLKKLSEGEDIESVVDIDEVLRYAVVHNFVVNGDSYTGSMVHNYYLYEENGRLSMIPWDYNLAFGTFQGNNASNAVNDPIDTPLSVTGNGDRPIIDWIFSSEEYTELYHQYFAEFLNTTDFAAMIDMTAELIAPYVEKDATAFYSYEEFETGVSALREFCLLREKSIQGQLSGSIPSTNEGQSADGAALVDTAALSLSDMGTMNMGGMGFGMGGNRGGNRGDANIENFSGGRTDGFGGPEGDRIESETQNGNAGAPSDNGTSDAGTERNPMQERSQMGGISPGERSASGSPTGGDQRQGQLPPDGMPSGEQNTDAALSEGDDMMQRCQICFGQ